MNRRNVLILAVGFVLGLAAAQVAGQRSDAAKVDSKGVKSAVLYEKPVTGFLKDLNGKYKLRVSETTIAPGGYIGDHMHLGPGIRKMTSGSLSLTMGKRTVAHKNGEFFFEAGDVRHRVDNRTAEPGHSPDLRDSAHRG